MPGGRLVQRCYYKPYHIEPTSVHCTRFTPCPHWTHCKPVKCYTQYTLNTFHTLPSLDTPQTCKRLHTVHTEHCTHFTLCSHWTHWKPVKRYTQYILNTAHSPLNTREGGPTSRTRNSIFTYSHHHHTRLISEKINPGAGGTNRPSITQCLPYYYPPPPLWDGNQAPVG